MGSPYLATLKKNSHSNACSLPFLSSFPFLFLPSPWLQGAPHYRGLEGHETVCRLNLFFLHSRERELEQERCRQDTFSPPLTTSHAFKLPILTEAKATAAKWGGGLGGIIAKYL